MSCLFVVLCQYISNLSNKLHNGYKMQLATTVTGHNGIPVQVAGLCMRNTKEQHKTNLLAIKKKYKTAICRFLSLNLSIQESIDIKHSDYSTCNILFQQVHSLKFIKFSPLPSLVLTLNIVLYLFVFVCLFVVF